MGLISEQEFYLDTCCVVRDFRDVERDPGGVLLTTLAVVFDDTLSALYFKANGVFVIASHPFTRGQQAGGSCVQARL
jgi:hypothetical protein